MNFNICKNCNKKISFFKSNSTCGLYCKKSVVVSSDDASNKILLEPLKKYFDNQISLEHYIIMFDYDNLPQELQQTLNKIIINKKCSFYMEQYISSIL